MPNSRTEPWNARARAVADKYCIMLNYTRRRRAGGRVGFTCHPCRRSVVSSFSPALFQADSLRRPSTRAPCCHTRPQIVARRPTANQYAHLATTARIYFSGRETTAREETAAGRTPRLTDGTPASRGPLKPPGLMERSGARGPPDTKGVACVFHGPNGRRLHRRRARNQPV